MKKPEQISVFDIIKIGVGPSSSHTMGPWRAALKCLAKLEASGTLSLVVGVHVDLYGSLAKTGRGHGTGLAVLMGLRGENPITVDTATLREKANEIRQSKRIMLYGKYPIDFDPTTELLFHMDRTLPFHPNGIRFTFTLADASTIEETYYSIGGGFVAQEGEGIDDTGPRLPHPCQTAGDLLAHCNRDQKTIAEIVLENERTWRSTSDIEAGLDQIWAVMQACVYRGCHTPGELPGGLQVKRRAPELNRKLLGESGGLTQQQWLDGLRKQHPSFQNILKWVSCFAIAANEENADFGRVVTAPTNGASGVIPAVLFYYTYFCDNVTQADIRNFLLVAGELGSLFKKGATISAALGGCQAEIGVSSAMAAGALTECLGGTPAQALMAAEIAMEHHLGLTCDPIGGLVQIPCIERNSMGAVKAITACNIALDSDPESAKVSLDTVIKTMWHTALDMHHNYKETAEGGLAINIPVNVIEC